LLFCPFHDLLIADQVGNAKCRNSGLPRAKELTGAPYLQICLCDPEAIGSLNDGVQALVRDLSTRLIRQQQTCGFLSAAPYTAAKLVEPSQSEAFCVLNEHNGRIRHVDTDLYDCSCFEQMNLAILEPLHDAVLFLAQHTSM